MRLVRRFALFWWDFVVGDDWRVALGAAVALALTWFLADNGENPWWLLPLAVPVLLAASLLRAARRAA
jgi:hypothetical protein